MMPNPLDDPKEVWKKDAACQEHPTEFFFPNSSIGVAAAIRICSKCLVMEECLEYALSEKIEDGVWGGCSERERRKIARKRRKIAAAVAYKPLQKGA